MKYTRKAIREVNNSLTGWVFAHLVNYLDHPVNQSYPLSKITHPVNYPPTDKIDTMIIIEIQFKPKLKRN